MVWKRDPFKGEFTEEKTRKVDPDEGRARTRNRNARTRVEEPVTGVHETPGPGRTSGAGRSRFEDPTQKVDAERRRGQREPGEGRTRVYRRRSDGPDAGPGPAARPRPSGAADPMDDPVVGWLVVMEGPGQGQVCRLGSGRNRLGRGAGSEVRLDFGDEQISRENHAVVSYDFVNRTFYVQHGDGRNLTYLGDAPVLTPTPLEAMQDIRIGGTTLRFVPFCGPDFDWQDVQDR